MAKHRAPRYVRTKKVIAKAPVAAGATVVGFGVLSAPSQAFAGTTVPLPSHAVEVPVATAAADAAAASDYTVERGDTVAKIAAAHGQAWRELYQRNVAVIGADPNLIFPGQVLLTAGSAATAPEATAAPAPEAPAASAPEAPAAPAPVAGSVGDTAPAAPVTPLAAAVPAPVAAPAPAAAPAATARITNTAGDVAPQAQAAANRVVSEVPGAGSITLGGTRASAADPNGHPSGLAVDYMVGSDAALGDAIVAFHVAHWDELGVEYVIWQQRILNSPTGVWKAMGDRGSATANHMDHPHVNYLG